MKKGVTCFTTLCLSFRKLFSHMGCIFANLNQPKNLEALSRAFYVVALLLGSWYYLLRPVESSARDAYDALCGHDAWHIFFFDCHITSKGK